MLFNIYLYDIPPTNAEKYTHADGTAIRSSSKKWEVVENNLIQDVATLATYLNNWRLVLIQAKSIASSFHLSDKKASCKLNIKLNGKSLSFEPSPTYLGIKLDHSLTFRKHLEGLRGKVSSHSALLRHLAGTTWDASTKVLHITALALVYAPEYVLLVVSKRTYATH